MPQFLRCPSTFHKSSTRTSRALNCPVTLFLANMWIIFLVPKVRQALSLIHLSASSFSSGRGIWFPREVNNLSEESARPETRFIPWTQISIQTTSCAKGTRPTKRQLWGFLSLTGHCRLCVPKFSETPIPLFDLPKSLVTKPFLWEQTWTCFWWVEMRCSIPSYSGPN